MGKIISTVIDIKPKRVNNRLMSFFFSTPKIEDVLSEARKLLKESKLKAAADLLKKAQKKNLFHAELCLAWSQIHAQKGDQSSQRAAILEFIAEHPNDVLHHLKVVDFLLSENDHHNAQYFLTEIKRRFPLSGFTHTSQALLHCEREEYELAAGSLLQKQEVKTLDDGDTKLILRIRKGIAGKPGNNALKLLSDAQVRHLLLRYAYERFESLGGDCEFGFHQRRHGKEPLSLFRWAGMPRERMVELFNNQLKDFASIETAALKPNAPGLEGGESLEFYFHDIKYEYYSHTSTTKKSVNFVETEVDILNKLRPHFLMLTRKLREDLEDGEKVFIYKSRPGLSIENCIELHDALCTLGNNKLIIILLKEEGKTDFEVIRPNLLIARVTSWWGGGASEYTHPITKEWDFIIERAYQHFVTHYPELDLI